MNKFVARKGLLSLGDTIVPALSSGETTIQGGVTADKGWDVHLNDAIVIQTSTSEGKFILVTIDGQYYSLPLYAFAPGVGEFIIEDPRPPIQFRVR